MLVNVKDANTQLFQSMECYVKGVMMQAGYDETWIELMGVRIMTCRLTCGYGDGLGIV